ASSVTADAYAVTADIDETVGDDEPPIWAAIIGVSGPALKTPVWAPLEGDSVCYEARQVIFRDNISRTHEQGESDGCSSGSCDSASALSGVPEEADSRVSLLLRGVADNQATGDRFRDLALYNPKVTPEITWTLEWRRAPAARRASLVR